MWYTEIFETPNCSPTKHFGTVWQKHFDGETRYPLICKKFFDTPKFLKHWSDALEIFRHCETKTFRRKNVISPFSSTKLFEIKNFLKKSRVTFWKFSALRDTQILNENRDMPPTYSYIFLKTRFFSEKQKVSFTKLFVSVLWDKRNRQNAENISIPEFFRKAEVFSHEFHCHCQRKIFQRSLVIWPSYAYIFAIHDIFWNTEVFPNEKFRYCETRNFERKTSYHLFCIKYWKQWWKCL